MKQGDKKHKVDSILLMAFYNLAGGTSFWIFVLLKGLLCVCPNIPLFHVDESCVWVWLCVFYKSPNHGALLCCWANNSISTCSGPSRALGSLPVIIIPQYLEAAGPYVSSPQPHQVIRIIKISLSHNSHKHLSASTIQSIRKSSWLYLLDTCWIWPLLTLSLCHLALSHCYHSPEWWHSLLLSPLPL